MPIRGLGADKRLRKKIVLHDRITIQERDS